IHLLRYCEDELTIWTEINHQFIVRLYGAIRHGVKVYIFSEFIDGGDLAACIEEQKLLGRRLSHWSAINYFKQLLDVLAYLQSKNILHEDIKADNILLRNKTTFIAVTDFGTSRKLQDPKQLKNKMPVGSPTHWSPEKASMEGHGFPSDLWAAVCVLVHMLSGWPPWVKRFNKAGILNYIIYAQPPPMDDVPHNVQEGVRKLIEKGLVKNPVLRPSPIQLLQDPAFRILDDEKFETCYSTLMSQSPRAIPRHGESCDETYDQNKLLSTTPLNVTSDKTVLYEQHISTVIHSEQQLAEKAENNEDHSANLVEVVIPAQGVSSSEMASLAEGYGQSQSDGPAQGDGSNFQVEEDLEASTIHDEVSDSPDNDKESYVLKERPHIESRICELIEPRNIENLLPAFALIYPDDGSENSLSIQQFFVDKYDDVTFNTFKDPLQFYQPAKQEPKQPARKDDPKQLPNLSIFNSSSSTSSSHVNTQERFSSIVLGQTKDMSCKDNAVVFTFSSGSDCTSSELFDMGQQGEISPPEATPNLSSTPTNLMMRKKENLKLNLGNTPPLSHSCSLPHNSNTDNESIKRPNTWTKLSSSTPKPPSQQQTPSTGRSTSSTRQGPSASTASSNIHSFFPSTKSVIEMQESVMQDMLGNLLKDPGMSSPSDNELSYETQPLMQTNDDKNYILNQFMQDIDDSALDGLKLEFFDSESIKLFDIRVTESPVYLRDVIQTIRYKVSEGFKHFTVNQLDGAILIEIISSDKLIGPRCIICSLPAKKWQWRARVSALYFSQTIPFGNFKVLFASSVLNLAELIALRPDLAQTKKVVYFHENQLIYPVQQQLERDFQYGYNQILTSMVADKVIFNSTFNMDTFLSSISSHLKLIPDHRPKNLHEQIRPKCQVVYFPLILCVNDVSVEKEREYEHDSSHSIANEKPEKESPCSIINEMPEKVSKDSDSFVYSTETLYKKNHSEDLKTIETAEESNSKTGSFKSFESLLVNPSLCTVTKRGKESSSLNVIAPTDVQLQACSHLLHIVWPHRWEHDKNPESFFSALFQLQADGYNFLVSVIGETFSEIPEIFYTAQQLLKDRIVAWGYQNRCDYFKILDSAHVAVSTAHHEFFGVSMLEAVSRDCYPLCPKRLVYPEIYPDECLYSTQAQLVKCLKRFCQKPICAKLSNKIEIIQRYSWTNLRASYRALLTV
ncbi:glycosyltransferase-like domain-containing protein 1, partial [Biomphalaria glabrata]